MTNIYILLCNLEIFVPATVLVAGDAGVPRELVEVWGVAVVADTGQEGGRERSVQEARPVEALQYSKTWPTV